MKHDVRAVGAAFEIWGEFLDAAPYGSGHINDTYASTWNQSGAKVRYIHQRINHNIFKDPVALMDNVHRVTSHQRRKLEGQPDLSRRALTLVPSRRGDPYWRDPEGSVWRSYLFIENAKTYDVIQSPLQAEQAARAFGRFQHMLSDLPAPRLHETIPGFHDSPRRFEQLEKAIAADVKNRAAGCKPEIDYCLAQKAKVGRLLGLFAQGKLPERITHNDTKLNNVMIDDASGEGICVIDLDTVMPGLSLYDFGDMVRTATMPVKEDEKDVSKVVLQWPMFEALAKGYLSSAGGFLNNEEKAQLPFGGWLITFEIGIRFFTDHLAGDSYFKIHREGHNLDRCRTQFALARDIERNMDKMNALVKGL